MRKFSDELVEDREFEIGGELFKWRYPYWVDFAERRDRDSQIIKEGADEETTFKDLYKDFIDRIEPFIDPENDGVTRWKTLTSRRKDPVPAYQFSELYLWLLEVTSGRPTELPSPSQNGQGQTDSTSQDASSSPATSQ